MNTASSDFLPRRDFIKQIGLTAAGAATAAYAFNTFAQDAAPVLTVAIVGCAHIHAPNYARMLSRHADVKVKWVWDHDADRAAQFAKQLGAQTTDDPKVIWSDPSVKAVVICSETNRHRDLVPAAAAAGKHMFVEKPLGINGEESRAMADAISKAGVIFTTGYFMRTQPIHIYLKQQVEQGAFGKITRADASNCHSGSLSGWFDSDYRWMADPKIAGVGAFGDLGTHSLDILMWLLGAVDSTTADIKVVTGRYGECDECGEALLKFKNGVTATLAAAWVDVANPVSLQISGTEGHALVIDGKLYFRSRHVEGADGRAPWTNLPEPAPEPLDQFLAAVNGKTGLPLVSSNEAAARVSVMEACYQGANTKAWVQPT